MPKPETSRKRIESNLKLTRKFVAQDLHKRGVKGIMIPNDELVIMYCHEKGKSEMQKIDFCRTLEKLLKDLAK